MDAQTWADWGEWRQLAAAFIAWLPRAHVHRPDASSTAKACMAVSRHVAALQARIAPSLAAAVRFIWPRRLAGDHTMLSRRLLCIWGRQQDSACMPHAGVDYVKYDNCYAKAEEWVLDRYAAMRDALNKTGRPIVYSLCNWGVMEPWLWGPKVRAGWGARGAACALGSASDAASRQRPKSGAERICQQNLASVLRQRGLQGVCACHASVPHIGTDSLPDATRLQVGHSWRTTEVRRRLVVVAGRGHLVWPCPPPPHTQS